MIKIIIIILGGTLFLVDRPINRLIGVINISIFCLRIFGDVNRLNFYLICIISILFADFFKVE